MDNLPTEILELIFINLSGTELGIAASCCRRWAHIMYNNHQRFFRIKCEQEGNISNCAPFKDHYELYKQMHHNFWLHDSIWIGDHPVYGSLMKTQFNHETGNYDLYQIRVTATLEFNEHYVMSLTSRSNYNDPHTLIDYNDKRALYTQLLQTQPLTRSRSKAVPPSRIWPPPSTIPSKGRCLRGGSSRTKSCHHYKPTETFRIRNWISFEKQAQFTAQVAASVETFARLDPDLVVVSASYNGLWVDSNRQVILIQEFAQSQQLQAVKLTSTNTRVPRGEVLFVADLGTLKYDSSAQMQRCMALVQDADVDFVNPYFDSCELTISTTNDYITLQDTQFFRVAI